jgi:hypothetical protein
MSDDRTPKYETSGPPPFPLANDGMRGTWYPPMSDDDFRQRAQSILAAVTKSTMARYGVYISDGPSVFVDDPLRHVPYDLRPWLRYTPDPEDPIR